jgi:CRP-like cAMP-binding protein
MHQKNITKVLMESQPFRYLTKDQVLFVQSFGEIVTFKNHKVILPQGKVGSGLYIILSGKTNVQIRILGEDSLVLAHMKIGNFFGEYNLLMVAQSTATVSAAPETSCFFLSKICFDSFSIGAPHIKYAIGKALVEDVVQRYRELNITLKRLLMKHPPTSKAFIKNSYQTLPASSKILSHSLAFQHFTEEEKISVARNTKILKINSPSFLIEPEKKQSSCFLILEGAVLANISCHDRFSHFVVHPPHTFICPSSLIDPKEKGDDLFSYYTGQTALLLEIKRDYLFKISQKNHKLWYKFHYLFCEYIFSLQKNLNMKVARLTHEKFMDLNQL